MKNSSITANETRKTCIDIPLLIPHLMPGVPQPFLDLFKLYIQVYIDVHCCGSIASNMLDWTIVSAAFRYINNHVVLDTLAHVEAKVKSYPR